MDNLDSLYDANSVAREENKDILTSQSQKDTLKREETLKLELQDFVNAVQTGSKPLVTLDDGINALKVIEASYEAFRTGKVVKL